jgi:hypothetical protein
MRFNFSDSNLTIFSSNELFPDISRQWFVFLPHTEEVEQIHTHKGPSDKSLFLPKAPSIKSTPPLSPIISSTSCYWKCQFSHHSGNIYLQLCVLLFHFNVSWFSEMQFGVTYFETWGSTQPHVAFSTLVFCSCFFVFCWTQKALKSLTLHEPESAVPWVKSV